MQRPFLAVLAALALALGCGGTEGAVDACKDSCDPCDDLPEGECEATCDLFHSLEPSSTCVEAETTWNECLVAGISASCNAALPDDLCLTQFCGFTEACAPWLDLGLFPSLEERGECSPEEEDPVELCREDCGPCEGTGNRELAMCNARCELGEGGSASLSCVEAARTWSDCALAADSCEPHPGGCESEFCDFRDACRTEAGSFPDLADPEEFCD